MDRNTNQVQTLFNFGGKKVKIPHIDEYLEEHHALVIVKSGSLLRSPEIIEGNTVLFIKEA